MQTTSIREITSSHPPKKQGERGDAHAKTVPTIRAGGRLLFAFINPLVKM